MARRRRRQPEPEDPPPPVVQADAEPNVLAVPGLQEIRKVRCSRCGGKALRDTHWKEWRYYRCAANPVCVDSETMKPLITKARAVD